VGIYSEAMKRAQIAETRSYLDVGRGYMLASTWLQAPPPQGPNHVPGGDGTLGQPGIRWWLEWLQGYCEEHA
jgi:hypothetical protein